MSKLDTFKKVAKFVVGLSTSWTVGNVIANNTNAEKPHQKVEAYVGGVVVGSMVADAAEEHIDKKIDEIAAFFRNEKDDAKLNIVV